MMTLNIKRLLLILLLFFSTDTVLFGTNSNRLFLYIPRIVGILFILTLIIIGGKKSRFAGKEVILFASMLLLLSVSAVLNNEDPTTVLSRIISVSTAYYLAKHYSIDEFIDVFLGFVYVISIASILLEGIYYFAPGLLNYLPTITNTAGYYFKSLFLSSVEMGQRGFCRAGGIFWEPGAFGVYLNFAIYFSLFHRKKLERKKIIVYIGALLLTLSTTGYVSVLILGILYTVFGEGFSNSKMNKSVTAFCLIAIGVMIVLNNTMLFDSLFGKLINKSSTTMVRIASILGGFQIALTKPFFGVFASNIRSLMLIFQPSSGGMLTSTIAYQFAAYGFPFGILFVLFSVKFFVKNNSKVFLSIGMLVFWIVIFISETFFSFLPFIFVFYGMGGGCNENCDY